MKRKILPVQFILMLALVGFGANCQAATASTSAKNLKKRAAAYWHYRVKGDQKAAYQYETPKFRKKVKLQAYLDSMGKDVKWLSAHVERVSVKDNTGDVAVKIRYVILNVYCPKKGLRRDIQDSWELVNGVWYHDLFFKQKSTPAKKKPAKPKTTQGA